MQRFSTAIEETFLTLEILLVTEDYLPVWWPHILLQHWLINNAHVSRHQSIEQKTLWLDCGYSFNRQNTLPIFGPQ